MTSLWIAVSCVYGSDWTSLRNEEELDQSRGFFGACELRSVTAKLPQKRNFVRLLGGWFPGGMGDSSVA